MAISSNLGFPRIGPKRELKKGVEGYWGAKIKESELRDLGRSIRKENWLFQQKSGIAQIPSNDFSFYDHVLDLSVMVGAIPARFRPLADLSPLDQYFAMARGYNEIPAMEMTKWFDTNYHFIVPEFENGQKFALGATKCVDEFNEAKALGVITTPVLLGPVSYLALGKGIGFEKYDLLPSLLCVYAQVLAKLMQAGATSVQFDEPALVFGIDGKTQAALTQTYTALAGMARGVRISIATYFEGLGAGLESVLNLPVSCVHLDLVTAPDQLEVALAKAPATLSLSLGVVDGRNIWRSDLAQAYQVVKRAVSVIGTDRVVIAPSCSLLHVPVSLDGETDLDPEVGSWLAFATEKVEEVALITRAINEGEDSVRGEFATNKQVIAQKKVSKKIHNEAVWSRVKAVTPDMLLRKSPHAVRKNVQAETYHLPTFPTTTIGSFPQTTEIREARAAYKSAKLGQSGYETVLRSEIEKVIRFQEEIGLDVLVHGEAERNDMVEYFGEQLSGFVFTKNGWVQSYGSRCVKPPIIFGDVARPEPMTVRWARFAQSLSKSPVKGMLTGPITILKWSFVRNDQPLSATCLQIALAIRDEVRDLEAAGIGIIQIDEAALREGLPLLRSRWPEYLSWAVDAFRLSTSAVSDETQIHTHMCYSDFNDIIESISAMDADVISIEASRSQMELLNAFIKFKYPNEIGPGVYDIHSPRIPSKKEMVVALKQTLGVIDPKYLWVNPDCGLKTRKWEEVRPALVALVEAAKAVRADYSKL